MRAQNVLQCANKQHRHIVTHTHTHRHTQHISHSNSHHTLTHLHCRWRKLLLLVHVTPTLPRALNNAPPKSGLDTCLGRSRSSTCTCLSSKNTEIKPDTRHTRSKHRNPTLLFLRLRSGSMLHYWVSKGSIYFWLLVHFLILVSFSTYVHHKMRKMKTWLKGALKVPNYSDASITTHITLFSILKLELFLVILPLSLPSFQRF